MERTIRVTGKGSISLKPDTLRLHITLEGLEQTYAAALERCAEQTDEVKATLESLGFTRDEMKTTRFDISSRYNSVKDKNGNYKNVFAGYEFTHGLKLLFPLDNERINKVLTALASCKTMPESRMEFTVAEPEQAKNALLANAVADSRTKARALTAAAGVQLGEILTIDYSWGEVDIYSRVPMDMECCAKMSPNTIDFTPEDIDLSDTVTVVWRIQ